MAGSVLLRNPRRCDLLSAFRRALYLARCHPSSIGRMAQHEAAHVGTFGSIGFGGNDHVAYVVQRKSGQTLVRIWPRSIRSVVKEAISPMMEAI